MAQGEIRARCRLFKIKVNRIMHIHGILSQSLYNQYKSISQYASTVLLLTWYERTWMKLRIMSSLNVFFRTLFRPYCSICRDIEKLLPCKFNYFLPPGIMIISTEWGSQKIRWRIRTIQDIIFTFTLGRGDLPLDV